MRKFFKGATFYILIFIVVLFLAKYMTSSPDEAKKFDVTQLVNQLETEKVLSVTLSEATHVSGVLKDGTKFESTVPDIMAGAVGNYLFKLSNEGKISLNGVPVSSSPWYMDLLPMVFMVLIFVVFWFVFMQNSQGGGSKVMSFGKSKAKLQKKMSKRKLHFLI